MYGEVIDAVIGELRKSRRLASAKLSMVAISTDETQTVNTPLPAVAVGFEESMGADVFIGGAIRDRLNLRLCVMVDLTNFSWSPDSNEQARLLSLGHLVRREFEQAKTSRSFDDLYRRYDFFPLYRGFKTYQRIAMRNDFRKEVSIFELVYQTTMIDKQAAADCRRMQTVENVDITGFTGGEDDLTTHLPHPPKEDEGGKRKRRESKKCTK